MIAILNKEDTIAAIATASGEGGVAIVRISGTGAPDILREVFRPKRAGEMKPFRMRYGHVVSKDGDAIDEAMCVYFRKPKTYTAEDVCEIQCHGGQVQARRVLARVIEEGARLAEPGEFTRRAYENGRISLTEAEAVLSLVRAESELMARSALRQLSGSVSAFISEVRGVLTSALARIEATIDFPDEVDESGAADAVREAVEIALQKLDAAIDERCARAVREGASVVLAGSPNVGKSSLLNAILKRDRAIVSDIPGTTRDVLTETIRLSGLSIELSDTAGFREAGDPVEALGVSRASIARREADLVFVLIDASRKIGEEEFTLLREADDRYVFVINKTDIADPEKITQIIERETGKSAVCVSAKEENGIEALYEIMRERLSGFINAEPILVNLRQIQCAKDARTALMRARQAMDCPLDLAAADIWDALEALNELEGNAREAVIDRIFHDFCVGK